MCGHRQRGLLKKLTHCAACGDNLAVARPIAKVKLFSSMQIAAAAFLGRWLLGFLIMAANYLRLNSPLKNYFVGEIAAKFARSRSRIADISK